MEDWFDYFRKQSLKTCQFISYAIVGAKADKLSPNGKGTGSRALKDKMIEEWVADIQEELGTKHKVRYFEVGESVEGTD